MTTAKKPHGASRAHSNRINVRLLASEWEMFQRKAAAEGKEPNTLLMEIIQEDIQQRTPTKLDAPTKPRAVRSAPRRRISRQIPFRKWQMLKHSAEGGRKLRSALQLKIRQRRTVAYRPAAAQAATAATGIAAKLPAPQTNCHPLSNQIQTVADVAGTRYLHFPWQMLLGGAPEGVLHPATAQTAEVALQGFHTAQRLGMRLCAPHDFFEGCGDGFFLVRADFCKVSICEWPATVESVHEAIERNGFRPVPLYFGTGSQPRMICGAAYDATGAPVFTSSRGAETGTVRHRAARVEIRIPMPKAA